MGTAQRQRNYTEVFYRTGGTGGGAGAYPVTYADITTAVLPTGASFAPDGTDVVDQDTVLFTALTLGTDVGIYTATVDGGGNVTAWTRVVYNPSQNPFGESVDGDLVTVQSGTLYGDDFFKCTISATPTPTWIHWSANDLDVEDEGISIEADTKIINFTGDKVITHPAAGEVGVEVQGVTKVTTLIELKAVKGPQNKLAYCKDTNTIYEYVLLGAAYAANDQDVVITGDSGTLPDSRWIGVAGKYIYYVDTYTTGNTNLQAIIDYILSTSVLDLVTVTHAQLKAHIAALTLIPGQLYLLDDYETKHQIPDTSVINVGANEKLILSALTTSTISEHAISQSHPEDLIKYDYANELCEDGVTARKGYIMYRKDTKREIDFFFDFRVFLSRRFAHNVPTYGPALPYTAGDIFSVGGGINRLYYCYNDAIAGTAFTDSDYFIPFVDFSTVPNCLAVGATVMGVAVTLDPAVYTDHLALAAGGTYKDIHGGIGTDDVVIFDSCYGIDIGNNDSKTTLFGGNSNTSIGNDCSLISLSAGAERTNIQHECTDIIIASTVGIPSMGNNINSTCYSILIDKNCNRNDLDDGCYLCSIAANSSENVLGNSCDHIRLGDGATSNTLEDVNDNIFLVKSCKRIRMGQNNTRVTLGVTTLDMDIGNYNIDVEFGDDCSDSVLYHNNQDCYFPGLSKFIICGNLQNFNIVVGQQTLNPIYSTDFGNGFKDAVGIDMSTSTKLQLSTEKKIYAREGDSLLRLQYTDVADNIVINNINI